MKPTSSELQTVYNTLYSTREEANVLISKVESSPALSSWKSFLEKLLLGIGAIQLLAGIIFFFAYNWKAFHRFGKMGIVASLLLCSAGSAIYFTKNKNIFKASLAGTSVLTGVLLALMGQIYQTGADSYLLFLLWAILVTPITIIAKSPINWALWVILLNITITFHAGQYLREWLNPFSALFIIVVNGGAIAIFEFLKLQKRELQKSNWFVSLFTLYTLAWLSVASAWSIFDKSNELLILMNLIVIASVVSFYLIRVHALGQIALSFLSLITMIFSSFIKVSNFQSAGSFLFSGIVLIIIVSAAVKLLLYIKERWEIKDHA